MRCARPTRSPSPARPGSGRRWQRIRPPRSKASRGFPAELVGRHVVGKRKPAIDLVDVAEIALEIPDERNTAVIKVGEVDAGAEHAASLVFRMLDDGPAHDGDFARSVEQGKIDTDLRAVERGLIFRIEKARIVL